MKENYKILYIAHERLLGGASLSLVTLADEMKAKGHTVGAVVPFYFSPLAKELRRRGIKTYWVFFGWWMMSFSWPKYLQFAFRCVYALEKIPAWMIAGIIKRNGYQIIHSNSSTIDVGSKAAQLAGVQHVWHFREFGDSDYNLEFLKGRDKSIQALLCGKDEIVFISKRLSEHYKELQTMQRTRVIYNGISEKYLNHHIHNNEKVVFLISGNLHRNKRQDLVLQAVCILKEWGIEKFEVWVAGGAGSMKTSRQYAQELADFIEEHELQEVKMLGRISNMNEIRRKADVEIVASTLEAFGRVTVEAMLSANPVLASDSGANPELVTEDKNGWLFEPGNANMLADRMKLLIENPEMIARAGQYAYQFAEENFLSERNTERIEQLYQELMNRTEEKA